MPLHIGGSDSSEVSSPENGPLTDRLRQSYTNPEGYSSGYSIWAEHIDPSKPIGLFVHLHGDGAYEYKNDPDTWYLLGPTGMLTLARERNMIFVVPFTPDREVGEINAETWWEDIVPHVGWAADLINKILGEYSIDLRRLWISGFSGGAEAISHSIIPHHLESFGAHAGGLVIIGGGGAPYEQTQAFLSSPLKSTFPVTWVVGENDRAEFAYDNYDGRIVAEEGESAYRQNGWNTDLVVVPDQQHILVDGEQGLYGKYIGEAMDAAGPVKDTQSGEVISMYIGSNPIAALYYGPHKVWESLTHE